MDLNVKLPISQEYDNKGTGYLSFNRSVDKENSAGRCTNVYAKRYKIKPKKNIITELDQRKFFSTLVLKTKQLDFTRYQKILLHY